MPGPRVFLLIPTHTTRHLAPALASVACSTDRPDGVVLTCDNDRPDIPELALRTWRTIDAPRRPPLVVTHRSFRGVASLNQVRNNGLRALDERFGLRDEDLVVVVDGDTCLEPRALSEHRAERADLVIPFRVDLTEDEVGLFEPAELAGGAFPPMDRLLTPTRLERLAARQQRYERQLRQKKTPIVGRLVKAHKPKLIGGHHAVRVRALRAVNGYDEAYTGYGYDDDDLSRRLHRTGAGVSIRVGDVHAFHLWHPTRAPEKPSDAPGYGRFIDDAGDPIRADLGWQTPGDQPEVVTIEESACKG
ncbi:MAG: glycosyltransferase family 2 protein [Planctomycetota bacterium]